MSRVLIRLAVALALFVVLAGLRVATHYPAPPSPLVFELTLEPGAAGRADPLIVSGRTHAGDFLSVRFRAPETVEFVYDSWGVPGIASAPISFQPGQPLRLAIEMPGLQQIRGRLEPGGDRVRVTCSGVNVLDTPAHYFVREPERLYFGINPLGGTACGPALQGTMRAPDGRLLRGRVDATLTRSERVRDWLRQQPLQPLVLLAFSLVAAFFGDRPLRRVGLAPFKILAPHAWFIGSGGIATLAYAWLVTTGTFEFNYAEVFGSFYDYQAASLLQGRLDVPEDAIGGEAFEAGGKLYGYFGPTPALLRLPFVISGFAFARLSRAFMVAYFAASLVAAYLILRHALRLASAGRKEGAAPGEPTPFAVLSLVGSVGLGSTLFFLGSRSFIFHEAILAGIAFALWSAWCSLRHLHEPGARWWLGAFACGLLSIHARPPTGLFALTLLGVVTLLAAWRERKPLAVLPPTWRRHLTIGALSILGVLSLNGMAWLKFRTFDAAPLRISRPYTRQPGRLDHVEGRSFHLANLPFNIDTYLLRPNARLESRFPWIYLGARTPRRPFPEARIDLADFTLALPYAMPSLFLLATLGSLAAAWAIPGTRRSVVALWIAAAPMALALLAAIATAQRYTGDFCPFLIGAAAFGLAAVEASLPPWRRLWRVSVAAATVGAIAVTVALTLHYQGETVWGVPEEARHNYQTLRRRVDAFFGRAESGPLTVPPPRTDVDL